MKGKDSVMAGIRVWVGNHKVLSAVILLLVIMLIASLLIFSILVPRTGVDSGAIAELESMSQTELEAEKLHQEVLQLAIENQELASPWQKISSYATIITVVVAVLGAFATIWKQISENRQDREQRETDSRRRMDDKFTSIVKDLGSENPSLQVSAAVSLMTFLREEYTSFHEQVYLVLLANLKVKHEVQLNRLLIQAFTKALKLRLERQPVSEQEPLDLTNTNLYRIDLSGLNLPNTDIAFADMQLANLREANLFRVRGYQVNLAKASLTRANLGEARLAEANLTNCHFHETNLVSATMKKANLSGAEFFEAKLQAARLDEANVSGARFERSDLSDTYFLNAIIPDQTLKSIRKALNWEKAHFDEATLARLEKITST